jgi:hypothetical protein
MERHLSAIELKRDGRPCTFDDSAARCLEQGLYACPFDVSIDWIGEHPLESLTVGSIHTWMIALPLYCAIIFPECDQPWFREAPPTWQLD